MSHKQKRPTREATGPGAMKKHCELLGQLYSNASATGKPTVLTPADPIGDDVRSVSRPKAGGAHG